MAELIAQENFSKIHDFPVECRIESVQTDPRVKNFFKNASKTGFGVGIPDAVYLIGETLVIIEIKAFDMKKAVLDAKHYYSCIRLNGFIKDIITVSFIKSGKFKIFENDNEIFPDTLKAKDLNLKLNKPLIKFKTTQNDKEYSKKEMDKNFFTIHNFIRDNCHITSREKIILVLGILTGLKDNKFKKEWNKYYDNSLLDQFLFDSIKKVYSDKLNKNDTDERLKNFLFIKSHESFKNSNNLHKIIELVVEIQQLNYTGDLINLFYCEFVKYTDVDGQALGIVLTPDYITELMCFLLEINENDTVLDICTGTSSFLLSSLKYNPKKLIGCEMQNDLFLMAESNFILRNVNNYELHKGNCFNFDFKATKSISNPPFGQKKIGEKELDFFLKQINCTKNGLSVCVFPQSCISNNKQNLKLKQKIMSKATVKTVITLNNQVFYPNASVGCSIILVDTSKPHEPENDKVLLVNFNNDGYEIQKHTGKVLVDSSKLENIKKILCEFRCGNETEISCFGLLTEDSEWSYFAFCKNRTTEIDLINLQLRQLELQFEMNKLHILNREKRFIKLEKTKMFKICDIFDIETVKKSMTTIRAKKNPGNVPYISASKLNNGITCYTKHDQNFTLNRSNCLTIVNAGDGGCGYTFFQNRDFFASSSIYILRFKDAYKNYVENIKVNLFFCQIISKLHSKYGFNRGLKINKLIGENAEEIELPVDKLGCVDFELINDLYDSLG